MANNWFQDIISDYERQILPGAAPRTMQITLAADSVSTWEAADKPYFICEWELPVMPSVGMVSGNKGQSIVYGLPLRVAPNWEVIVHDYDVALRDVLMGYAGARTKLRFWAWGVFVAVGYIAQCQIQSPLGRTLTLNIVLQGLRYIQASAEDQIVDDFDLSSPIHMLDIPYATTAASETIYKAHTILYGTEILP